MVDESAVYAKLAEKLNYPPSENLLMVLKKMITPEQGVLLLELPAPPPELAAKTSFNEGEVKDKLKEFLRRGLVVGTKKGFQLVRDVMQLHDASLASSQEYIDEELLELWKQFYETEWCRVLADFWQTIEKPMCGVIPAWNSLQDNSKLPNSGILPEENIVEIIKGAESIAVVPCSCRRPLRNCDAPLEVCRQFNRWAEYAVDRGAGKKVSIEEALDINKLAEEKGLIHVQPRVTPGLALICNCCSDCCALIDPCLKYGGMDKALEKSRYRAGIDEESCIGCLDCIEMCPFKAIEEKDSSASNDAKAVIDHVKCFGCGVCVSECPTEAISLQIALLNESEMQ